MLPVELSEGLVSLNSCVDRRALVFEMELDAAGEARRTRIVQARIHSRAKLAYDDAQALHDSDGHGPLSRRAPRPLAVRCRAPDRVTRYERPLHEWAAPE
jgi:exoribonuclease R